MMYLISYDISHNSIRTKLAKELLKAGLERVQYSVFIGDLSDTERVQIEQKMEKHTEKGSQYSILIVPLHQDMLKGMGEISSQNLDWEYLSGEKKILII